MSIKAINEEDNFSSVRCTPNDGDKTKALMDWVNDDLLNKGLLLEMDQHKGLKTKITEGI